MKLQACHCCGLIHEIPAESRSKQSAVCTRCRTVFKDGRQGRRAAARTAALAVAAFVVFWPAVLLPIVEIERLGHRHASSLLFGSLDLLRHGELVCWTGGAGFLDRVSCLENRPVAGTEPAQLVAPTPQSSDVPADGTCRPLEYDGCALAGISGDARQTRQSGGVSLWSRRNRIHCLRRPEHVGINLLRSTRDLG